MAFFGKRYAKFLAENSEERETFMKQLEEYLQDNPKTIEDKIRENKTMKDFTNEELLFMNSMNKKDRVAFVNSLDVTDRVRNNLEQRLNYHRSPEKYKAYVEKYQNKKKVQKAETIANVISQLGKL